MKLASICSPPTSFHFPGESRGRDAPAGSLALRGPAQDLPARGARLVRDVALDAGMGDADRVLRRAVARVERPPGGALRHRRAQVLSLWPRVLAAGRHLSHGAA